jgi:peptidylprolyl isomerase
MELANGALTVAIPEDLFLVEGLQIIKRGIANDVFKFVPSLSTLTFLEKFNNPKPQPKKEEVKAQEPKPAPKEAVPARKPRRKKAEAAVPTA